MFIYGFIKIRDKLWNCWIYTVYTVVCCGFAHPFHGSPLFQSAKSGAPDLQVLGTKLAQHCGREVGFSGGFGREHGAS